MKNRFSISFALIVLFCSCLARSASAGVICFDGTFSVANYADAIFTTDPAQVTSTVLQSANGNPGTALEVLNSWTAPFITFTTAHFLINPSCTFDPSKQGALQALDFSIDRNTSGTGVILGGTQNGRPLILQNGDFYVATVVGPTLVTGTYQTIFGAGLTAADFVMINPVTNTTSAIHPDFSAAGGPMQFGVYSNFGHSNSVSTGGQLTQLYDNLSYVGGSSGVLNTPAGKEIVALMNTINTYGLPFGTTTSLTAKLNAALSSLGASDSASACTDVSGLISEAQAQSGKKLTKAQADAIVAAAQQLQSTLGC